MEWWKIWRGISKKVGKKLEKMKEWMKRSRGRGVGMEEGRTSGESYIGEKHRSFSGGETLRERYYQDHWECTSFFCFNFNFNFLFLEQIGLGLEVISHTVTSVTNLMVWSQH